LLNLTQSRGVGEGAIANGTGTRNAKSPIRSLKDPVLLVGLLVTPRFWGACASTASQMRCSGALRNWQVHINF